MKRKGKIPGIALAGVLLLGVVIIVSAVIGVKMRVKGSKPFADLEASGIMSARVHLTPPDKTIQITEMEELASCLKDVVIYGKDDSYTGYCGQGVTFILTMADGRETSVMAFNPFLVIDGVGYQTKYEPCEALNAYANGLLDDEDACVILEEPPVLTVISDETAFEAFTGTYSWQRRNGDGTSTEMEADSPHPLDRKEYDFGSETTENIAVLRFQEDPDAILSVQCWSEEQRGNPEADGESVAANGYEIELKPGGYIYEVTAKWDAEKSGYGGIAHYCFYMKVIR